ncbi:MAG: hypothetical protein KJ930_12490 [Gammaproteobacteria bacterium]|jgi:hypothetical protein|nr:hypothetical protein [Gammaproteobacteria bacterium]MBU2180238.1 hypothetical protein [Gammaproteobacteria bacterium]MBU2223349.1 hypothetical protein [Gammaproteobacteria bacterium]MBU2280745.1 hypothetical protein [Gammaproteobacteria bacterium]MBU2426669.1 hypothetical protein [Gammaproteobacteria bacterium]
MKCVLRKAACIVVFGFSSLSQAGVYSDDLSRCLVESSTPADKSVLVKWMFTSMALHPDVAEMSKVSEVQRGESNKAAADMFTKLMTQTCVEQAKKAIKYEGPAAIQQGFTIFGQVAGQELFANPNVAKALAGLGEHIDIDKLSSVLGLPKQ